MKKSMKKAIREVLSDNNGKLSHKRVLAFMAFVALLIMIALKAVDKAIDDGMIYTMGSICIGQSGFTAISERWARKRGEEE